MIDKSKLIDQSKEAISDRITFDEKRIKDYVAPAFPKAKDVHYKRMPYAFSNKTYEVILPGQEIESVVLKVSVVPDRFGKLASEVGLLKKFNSKVKSPLPKVLYADLNRDKFEYPYCVLSYLPGENLVDVIGKVKDKQKFAGELAKIVAELHQLDYANVMELGSRKSYTSWHEFLKEVIEGGVFQMKDHKLDGELVSKVEKFFSPRIYQMHEPRSYSLVHRDIKPQNLRFDVAKQKISGLVDFESALTGDKHYDFSFIDQSLFQQFPEMRKAFFDTYSDSSELDEDYLEMVEFYNLFSDLYYVQRNLKYREMDRVKINIKRMKEFFVGRETQNQTV